MKHLYFIIGFLLWSNNSFSMELESSTINHKADLFDLLSPDTARSLFALLAPKEINRLRRSCKKLSNLFSFHNPSLEFISYKNPHISQKDLECLLITAVYDGKQEMVKALLEHKRIDDNYCYKIPTLSVGVFPYCIAPNKEILQNFDQEIARGHWNSLPRGGIDCCIPDQVLIACISRNRDRIKECSEKIKKINKTQFSFCWHVLIANKDNRSLQEVFQNIQISDDMKQMGNQLIEHAYNSCNSVAVRMLLDYGCYDDLNKIIIENTPKFIPTKGSINQDDFTRCLQVRTLLDRIFNAGFDQSLDSWNHPSRGIIYNLLRNKGARRVDELIAVGLINNEGKNKETSADKCGIQ